MIKLKLSDAQNFKIHIEDKIERESLFFHEYEIAAEHLNQIWQMQKETGKSGRLGYMSEDPNNVIAFCGERGSGKSSAMLSFVNAVVDCGNGDSVLPFDSEIRANNWNASVMIDPSMFDDVHNIVDIVLAHIYQSFHDAYGDDNQRVDTYERERMLSLLAKTYKSLSVIKNKEKMLEDEYDIAGNISKLQKLGQSTLLKRDLKELIDFYLELLPKLTGSAQSRTERKSGKLLIAIDDLDLCNKHAYEMAEQVRKYLILPNVIILMAIKIEQLQMGVEEKNRDDFKNVIAGRGNDASIAQEMEDMAERYVTKLIPKARRIYLPQLRSDQVRLVSEEQDNREEEARGGVRAEGAEEETETLQATVLRLIREKTGMYFVAPEGGRDYFVSSNLREFVSLILLLTSMKAPCCDRTRLQNIEAFKSYFMEGMLKKNIRRERLEPFLEVTEDADNIRNYNIGVYLNNLLDITRGEYDLYSNSGWEFSNMSLAHVTERLASVPRYRTRWEDYLLFYYIRIYYTILLNLGLCENGKISLAFTGGFIWGNRLNGLMPAIASKSNQYQYLMNRERFLIHGMRAWNGIADVLGNCGESMALQKKDDSQNSVSKIKDENWLPEVVCWLLLAFICSYNGKIPNSNNSKNYMNRASVVYNNYAVPSVDIEVSIENYIVNLCDLEDLYRVANLELLGIEKEKIQPLFDAMRENNASLIRQAEIIVTNMDLADRLIQYCQNNNDFKGSTKSEEDRTYRLFGVLFNNIRSFMERQGAGAVDWNIFWIPIRIKEGGEIEGASIDMSRLYTRLCTVEAEFLQESINNTNQSTVAEKRITSEESQLMKQHFAQQVQTVAEIDYVGSIRRISGSLQNKTADHVRGMLENIANCLQKYTFREKKFPEGFVAAPLIKLYSEVVDLCETDPKAEISEMQRNTYKAIAKIKDVIG